MMSQDDAETALQVSKDLCSPLRDTRISLCHNMLQISSCIMKGMALYLLKY